MTTQPTDPLLALSPEVERFIAMNCDGMQICCQSPQWSGNPDDTPECCGSPLDLGHELRGVLAARPTTELPELPESYGTHCVWDSVRMMKEPGYTADQMRAYATEAVLRAANARGDVEVPQFHIRGCSDWYDGYPDTSDGKNWETRVLYSKPGSEVKS